MGRCPLCLDGGSIVRVFEFLDHLRVAHPEMYGDGPECWPDGMIVVTAVGYSTIDQIFDER